uniref:TOR n=1 Tax=Arundo donax TaxID=35708 RepID=A0A0A9EAY0_ARUDO
MKDAVGQSFSVLLYPMLCSLSLCLVLSATY